MVARILMLMLAAACGPTMQQLTITTGSARHVMDIGYGVVYRAPVDKVVEGELADRTIDLRLFSDPSGTQYAGQFRSFDQPPVTLRFSLLPNRSELYEGFIADDGTVWKLVSVTPK